MTDRELEKIVLNFLEDKGEHGVCLSIVSEYLLKVKKLSLRDIVGGRFKPVSDFFRSPLFEKNVILFRDQTSTLRIALRKYHPYKLIDTGYDVNIEEILKSIKKQEVVGLDCEGKSLGRFGHLTLLQISVRHSTAFIFDVLNDSAIMQKLKPILEDPKIIKVVHDCRKDLEAIAEQFNIHSVGIFDTQIAYRVLTQSGKQEISLANLLGKYGLTHNEKTLVGQEMRTAPDIWVKRPLEKYLLDYAAGDVRHLITLYDKFSPKLDWVQFDREMKDRLRTTSDLKNIDECSSDLKNIDEIRYLSYDNNNKAVYDTAPHVFSLEEKHNDFESRNKKDLERFLSCLPPSILGSLHDSKVESSQVTELQLDYGRKPYIFFDRSGLSPIRMVLSDDPVSLDDIEHVIHSTGGLTNFSDKNRTGIENTLHRISVMRCRKGNPLGLSCRVGRLIHSNMDMAMDIIHSSENVLFIGAPGRGKTTILRSIARILSESFNVMIVDTSNEIGGDGDIIHPAIGESRRLQVPSSKKQHKTMIEAVQNHTPEVIIIDEIGTREEAIAAKSICRRGVRLMASAHAASLEELIEDSLLSGLCGNLACSTLGDIQFEKRGSKNIRERKEPPPFGIVVEVVSRTEWILHHNAANSVDNILAKRPFVFEERRINFDEDGKTKNGVIGVFRKKTTTNLDS